MINRINVILYLDFEIKIIKYLYSLKFNSQSAKRTNDLLYNLYRSFSKRNTYVTNVDENSEVFNETIRNSKSARWRNLVCWFYYT